MAQRITVSVHQRAIGGSVGDSYDSVSAESIIGLLKIRGRFMSKNNPPPERGDRSPIEDVGKKEQVLIDQLRRHSTSQQEAQAIGEALGVADEEILVTLQDLGYTRETVLLLHLVPLIQIAWASGSVTAEERAMVLRLCEWRGIKRESPAWNQLNEWLDDRPSDEFMLRTLRIIRHLLDNHPASNQLAGRTDLISFCKRIASVSGGFLGIGSRISGGEEEALNQIVSELTDRNPGAVQSLLDQQ